MILGKIIKTVATICHILKLKCTNFDLVLGLTVLPDSLLGFKGGATSKGRGREGSSKGKGREGDERER